MHPLIGEAMKKAAVVWLTVDGERAFPVWCLWQDDALYVVSEAPSETAVDPSEQRTEKREQPAPGLTTAEEAVVTARGDNGGRIVSWPARVSRVSPDDDLWQQVVPQLASKRLNLAADEDTAARWTRHCVVSRLEPAGDPLEAGDTLPDGSLSAPPAPTAAATPVRQPFRLHRVRGAGRR